MNDDSTVRGTIHLGAKARDCSVHVVIETPQRSHLCLVVRADGAGKPVALLSLSRRAAVGLIKGLASVLDEHWPNEADPPV